MAITIPNKIVNVDISPGTGGASLAAMTGVTAGSHLVVVILQYNSAVRTYTVADDVNAGDYVIGQHNVDGGGGGRNASVYYKEAVAGGDTIITLTSSGAATNCRVFAFEVAGAAPTPIVSGFTGALGDVIGNAYPCSASATEIDTTDDAWIVTGVVLDATATLSAGTGYTLEGGTDRAACQTGFFTGAQTDERGLMTESGTNRDFAGVILAYEVAGGGGGFQAAWAKHANRLIGGALS